MSAQSKPHPGLLPMSLYRMKVGKRQNPPAPTNWERFLAYLEARGPVGRRN